MKFAFVAVALLLPTLAFAQFSLGTNEPLVIGISPQHPRPGDTVIVTPKSPHIDMKRSTMTLSVGGKLVYSGEVKGVPVTLNASGQATVIAVTVKGDSGSEKATITLRPGDVSLVAEPVSSIPVLYPGKARIPQQGRVRYAAIADFRTSPSARLDPDQLSYSWIVNGTTILNSSGIGKDSIILASPLMYRTEKVSVEVSSRNGSLVASDTLLVTPESPTMRLYVHDPLQGILFDHALGTSHSITGSETTFTAVPFSFSLIGGEPVVNWFLNGTKVETGPNITLRPEGAGQGNASLTATANAGTETGTAALSIIFGESATNIFGL